MDRLLKICTYRKNKNRFQIRSSEEYTVITKNIRKMCGTTLIC